MLVSAGALAAAPLDSDEPTEAECKSTARAIETALNASDAEALRALYDINAVLEKALKNLKLSKAAEADYRRGIQDSSARGDGGFFKLLVKGNAWKLLRVVKVDGQWRARLRRLSQEDEFAYLDMVLARGETRSIAIVDAYVWAMGELISSMYRRSAIELAAHMNRDAVAKLTGWQSEFMKNLPAVREMQAKAAAGKFQEAYQAFRKLPAGLQKEKFMIVQAVAIARKVGDAEYQKALDKFAKEHPKDPALALLSIDAYCLKKKYGDALKAVDDLDKALGGDPTCTMCGPESSSSKEMWLARSGKRRRRSTSSPCCSSRTGRS